MLDFFYKTGVYYTRTVYANYASKGKLCLGLVDRELSASALADARKWAEDLCPYDGGWDVRIERHLKAYHYDGTEIAVKAPIFATVKPGCVLYYDLVMSPRDKATKLLLSTPKLDVTSDVLFNILSIDELTEELSGIVERWIDSGKLVVEDNTLRRPLENPDGPVPELSETASGQSQ